jgi:organic radical activating enzyme
METFHTLQGEGAHTGRSAWFIRLGGCDVGCVWCDVKESWDAGQHPLRSVEELTSDAIASGAGFVVITGGEPAAYDLTLLTRSLHRAGCEIALETSGAYPILGEFDWVCVSPKKFKNALPEALQMADELKVVIYHPSDLEWAEQNASMVKSSCLAFLQPEFSRLEQHASMIVDYIKENPRWRLSLQTHKVIHIP